MPSMWRATWVWLGCAVVITFVGCQWSGLTFAIDRMLALLALAWCAILIGATWVGQHPSLNGIAGLLQALAQLIATSIICALLQYVAVRTGRPLVDAELAALDHLLYFDWPACFAWVLQHPTVLKLLSWVYLSLGLQSVLVCIIAWRDPARAAQTLAANVLTLTFCLAAFVEWPAGGAFAHYHPPDIASDYVEEFMAARAGLLPKLAIGEMKGIIQFPSYHAAAAILFAYAFASLPRWIAIPALVIEATLVVSAVPIGGHHLADALAGVAVAALSLVITLAFSKMAVRDRIKPVSKAPSFVRA
ncbi:MAG TPA: phosphatase PAP2 family protein [Lacipirellulaceae bacterium]|nr:phosphatase PAP2 family protein [Lacipirellulaceae bacterium]